jgi:hypothetical protein
MNRTDWTIEISRFDKRTKEGRRPVSKYEYCNKTQNEMMDEIKDLQAKLYTTDKFRIDLHETYVTRTNLLTGVEYKEHYKTPNYCSPSSEAYWSM